MKTCKPAYDLSKFKPHEILIPSFTKIFNGDPADIVTKTLASINLMSPPDVPDIDPATVKACTFDGKIISIEYF